MPRHDLAWHENDIAEELEELHEARGIINRWSEYSDISYTYTRALWSGHKKISLPINYFLYLVGLAYMFPKYTLRWKFFHKLGKKLGAKNKVTEVRNPLKTHKLKEIAANYDLNADEFVSEANRLMKKSFFLK
jgi:hypothetical protein